MFSIAWPYSYDRPPSARSRTAPGRPARRPPSSPQPCCRRAPRRSAAPSPRPSLAGTGQTYLCHRVGLQDVASSRSLQQELRHRRAQPIHPQVTVIEPLPGHRLRARERQQHRVIDRPPQYRRLLRDYNARAEQNQQDNAECSHDVVTRSLPLTSHCNALCCPFASVGGVVLYTHPGMTPGENCCAVTLPTIEASNAPRSIQRRLRIISSSVLPRYGVLPRHAWPLLPLSSAPLP